MRKSYPSEEKVLYAELSPSEFRKRIANTPVAYLPLGTIEYHGEHLPLGSDLIQPSEFFMELAYEAGGIVLPALFLGPDRMEERNGIEYYGKDLGNSPQALKQQYESQLLTGSAYWIPDSLFISIIESILKQLKRQGFRILVAHGHGPSTNLLIKNSQRWEEEFGIKIFNLWRAEHDELTGFMSDHAGMLETSVIMKYRPELVHLTNLPDDPEVWPVGIRGYDPRIYASPDKGEEIVKIQKERIINSLKTELGR